MALARGHRYLSTVQETGRGFSDIETGKARARGKALAVAVLSCPILGNQMSHGWPSLLIHTVVLTGVVPCSIVMFNSIR